MGGFIWNLLECEDAKHNFDTDILNLLDADIILEREAKVADRKGSPGRVLSDCRLAPGCRIGA